MSVPPLPDMIQLGSEFGDGQLESRAIELCKGFDIDDADIQRDVKLLKSSENSVKNMSEAIHTFNEVQLAISKNSIFRNPVRSRSCI